MVMHDLRPKCHKCFVPMRARMAIKNTLVGHPDWIGDKPSLSRGRTVTRSGHPVLVRVWSCPECGHSIEV